MPRLTPHHPRDRAAAIGQVATGDRTTPVLDLGALRALIGDEPGIVHEFLADFLAAARRQDAGLREATVMGSFGDVRVLAHNLKSSSRSVGAHRLGDACQALERAALGGDAASIADGMRVFGGELALAEAEIRAALAGLDGRSPGETA